jgi:hypothetical protein
MHLGVSSSGVQASCELSLDYEVVTILSCLDQLETTLIYVGER